MLTKILHFTCEDKDDCGSFRRNIEDIVSEKEYSFIECAIYDINEGANHQLMEKYRVEIVPTTIFLDEKGEVNKRIMGIIPKKDLEIYINYELSN